MKKQMTSQGVKLTVDPHDHFLGSAENILADCGNLPLWFGSWSIMCQVDAKDTPPIEEFMNTVYPFGISKMEGGGITDDFTHTYPGDPDLHPLLTMGDENFTQFIQYQYAIVAWREAETADWFITRMD